MIVRREDGDSVLFNDVPRLKIRHGHADAQFPGFVAARNDTAIVIAENCNGFIPEIRPEHPLAAAVKTITIDDRFHYELMSFKRSNAVGCASCHYPYKLCITYVTTPQMENSDPERSTSMGDNRDVSGTSRILLKVFSSRRISISPLSVA